MSRRKRHAEHANHERWLVSYADFITLLFAFFVVLYSASQVDQKKVGKLAQAIQVAFAELGIFQGSTAPIQLQQGDSIPSAGLDMARGEVERHNLGRISPALHAFATGSAPTDETIQLQHELEQVMAPELHRNEAALSPHPEGLVLSLREVGFFDSGSDAIRPEAQQAVDRIAGVLVRHSCSIRVEGHTDNVPISTPRFASNWELSAARATSLVKNFIERHHLAPERLAVGGYGEYHPVASNASPQGRQLNRRVDLVLITGVAPRLATHPVSPGAVSGN